jgi:putative phage-type endonuclease
MGYSGDEDLVEVVQVSNEEVKADLQDRRTFIGGSDAPVIMGISPWKTPYQLWLEKTGQAPEADLSEIERVQWGIKLEDLVAREFVARTGMKVRRVNQRQRHKEKQYFVAQIDRRIVGGGILECKTTDGARKSDWDDGVPDHYLVQVQHQMMVTGESFAYVAVLFGGNTFQFYKVERDNDLIQNMEVILDNFWSLVQTKTPPEPSSTEEARQMWRKPSADVVIGGDDEKSILKDLLEVKDQIEALKGKQDELELALQMKLQDLGDTLSIAGIQVVSWKTQSRTSIDTKALELSYPDIASQFKRTSESRVFRVLKGAREL